jgi:RimJ/RimL family protein N-acetyltransferase
MDACRVRDALPEDAAALISLRKTIFGETNFMLCAPDEYSASADEVAQQLQRIRDTSSSRSLLAEMDGSVVGFLGVTGSSVPRLRHSAQLFIGVMRAHWGRGIGSALLSEVLRWAPTAGLSRLELYVMNNNERAIRLYERLGFKVEGQRRRAYIINGEPVDDRLMALIYEA